MEPTKEQIKWLWEQCGFSRDGAWWISPNNKRTDVFPPRLDLNNLFRYAVPLLEGKLGYKEAYKLLIRWITEVIEGKDPAESLFWAVFKALGGK